jgi:hypothetical protein
VPHRLLMGVAVTILLEGCSMIWDAHGYRPYGVRSSTSFIRSLVSA